MFCTTNASEVVPSACIDATSTSCPTAHLPHSIKRPSRFKATHYCAGHQTAIMAANRGRTVFRLTCLPHRRSSRSYQLATNRGGTRAQRNSLCKWSDLQCGSQWSNSRPAPDKRLETIGLGDRTRTAAATVMCSRADTGYGALSPRSLRWWVAGWNRAVRPPPRRPPKRSPLRLMCCGTPSRSTSIRMAEPAGSHQQRLPAITSPRRCGRDRWRSPALRTCRTLPS